MALEEYCASCTYMGEDADYNGKYYCDRKGERRLACDARCYNWCEAYSRSKYSRENMYENSYNHSSSGGCYITTAMCEILGYEDNNYYLQTLRKFRDNFLKPNRKYWGLLIAYDIVGPTIANYLSKDEKKVEIATTMLNNYIDPAVIAIEENQYETAVNIYTNMTNSLANKYELDSRAIIADVSTIATEYPLSLGHGKRRVLKQN